MTTGSILSGRSRQSPKSERRGRSSAAISESSLRISSMNRSASCPAPLGDPLVARQRRRAIATSGSAVSGRGSPSTRAVTSASRPSGAQHVPRLDVQRGMLELTGLLDRRSVAASKEVNGRGRALDVSAASGQGAVKSGQPVSRSPLSAFCLGQSQTARSGETATSSKSTSCPKPGSASTRALKTASRPSVSTRTSPASTFGAGCSRSSPVVSAGGRSALGESCRRDTRHGRKG